MVTEVNQAEVRVHLWAHSLAVYSGIDYAAAIRP